MLLPPQRKSDLFPRPAVVLTDNHGGLGAARSLTRRGIPVIAAMWNGGNLLRYSRFPVKKFTATGDSDQEKYSSLLAFLMSVKNENPVLISTADRMIAFMANHRDTLAGSFHFNIPSTQLLESLNDKKKETALISRIGIAVPRTVQDLPDNPADLEEMLRFPILLKPASFEAKKLFARKNQQVKTPSELRRFYEEHKDAIPVLLAQEVIPGPDEYSWVSSCTFNSHSEMLDCGIKQKKRMLPPHFGGSTFAISSNNPEVYELTRQVGRELGYIGHAGIEFRWDERDNQYKYIECNPRMPENVEFDEYCGMPTVWNSYQVALGKDPASPSRRQQEGVVYLDLDGDLRSRLNDGESLGSIFSSYLKCLFRRRKGLSFAFDDPLPGLVVAWRFLRSLVNRAWSKMS